MKAQHLFYGFLPGVTVAVLTVQPSWANNLELSQPNWVDFSLDISPNHVSPNHVLTNVLNPIYVAQTTNLPQQIVYKSRYIPELINQQIGIGYSNQVRAVVNPITQTSSINFVPFSRDRLLFDRSNTSFRQYADVDAKYSLAEMKLYNPEAMTNNTSVVKSSVVAPVDSSPEILSASLQQQIKQPQLNPRTQLTIVSPVPTREKKGEDSAAVLTRVLPKTSPVAQNQKPLAQSPTTNPATTPGQLPSYLNSNPNPLQFPTKAEEVRLQGTQPITLNQALEAARRNNKQLQVALLQLERSQAVLREAQASLLPNLSVNATINRGQSAQGQLQVEREIQNTPPAFRDQIQGDSPSTAFNSTAQLSYSLYTSGQRQATIRQAEEQLRASEFTVEQQSEDIRQTVTKQYYNLQQADEQVRISQSAVTNAEASLRDALALERAGVGTRFDVLRFQVNLANSQQNLTNSRSQQQIERRRLASILSVPQTVNLSAADPVKLAGLWNQSLEESIIQALKNRPELQQQLAQRNISEQQRRQALSQLGPQINLIASYNLLDQFNDQIPITDGYSVGVQASLNLYDGGASRARAAQASKNVQIAETNFANQRNTIRFEVEQAYSELRSNLENVQTATTALEQAKEALRLARLRFQAGVGTQTDVIAAENDLTQSEGNRIRAILDYNRALADIQRAVTIRGTQ
ncbi:TolC family protein [Calothrix sp. UHCC 0171]|uniref:TolC family protein n=1 Tax=Calothrix sp. UHCC 0171 TaxID=3110245 RepID=UPI002B212C2D|nr:TolC family protein [Calothrix sp. UHCC 0171]MEA5571525.1 TolC family protein [Calothrix sp. UHCC 0171]